MAIAITEDHQALGATVADLADKRQLLEANRSLLEASVAACRGGPASRRCGRRG